MPDLPPPSHFDVPHNLEITNFVPPPDNLTLTGDSGWIDINFKTGKVTLSPGMTPDAGAKAFWDAVQQFSPRCPAPIKKP